MWTTIRVNGYTILRAQVKQDDEEGYIRLRSMDPEKFKAYCERWDMEHKDGTGLSYDGTWDRFGNHNSVVIPEWRDWNTPKDVPQPLIIINCTLL